jgi:hypothetical protein
MLQRRNDKQGAAQQPTPKPLSQNQGRPQTLRIEVLEERIAPCCSGKH